MSSTVKKLSIIIPTFNESSTILELIRSVKEASYPIDYEIIIIDDASTDRTYEKELLIRKQDNEGRIKLFRNQINHGKGMCVRIGIQHASGDIFIVQDADLEYDPREIARLIEPILKNEADAVFGSRFLTCRWPEGMALPNFVGNKLLTLITNLLFGLKLTDEATCYKAVRREILANARFLSRRFAIDPEITSKLARLKARIAESPISYHGRSVKHGKKIKPRDFIYAVITLIYNRFARI